MSIVVTINETVNDVNVNAVVQTVNVKVEASDVANDIAASNAVRAELAREDVEALAAQITPTINQGLLDINSAANAGVQAVEDAEVSALQAIGQASADGVDSINDATNDGLSAIGQAKNDALQEVADSTITATSAATAAQTARLGAEEAEQRTLDAEQRVVQLESSASQSAQTATQQAGIATSAANTIANQIDFTGAQQFDFLQRDGVNFKAVRENVPLQRKEVFANSHLSTLFPTQNILFYDTFNRPNSPSLGTSDSGHLWENIIGTWSIVNNTAQCNIANGIALLPQYNSRFGGHIVSNIANTLSSFNPEFYFYKDADNWFRARFGNGSVILTKKILGIETQILFTSQFPSNVFSTTQLQVECFFYC